MNCFETRQEFAGFWRGELEDHSRRALIAHLRECFKCDRAFRAFALTAPLLHARAGAQPPANVATAPGASRDPARRAPMVLPIGMNGTRRADSRRAAQILRHASTYRRTAGPAIRRWREVAAGLSAVAAAMLLAYFSVAQPAQSFDQALTSPDSISEAAAQPDNDSLGQQIPSIPTIVSSDFAG